jgi:hypothetical protein
MKTPAAFRTAAAVILALSLAPLSAQAAPVVRSVPVMEKLDLTAWLPAWLPMLRQLWTRAWSGEGMSIDPNGKPAAPVVPNAAPAPGGAGLNEGMSLDPDGGH